MGFDWVSGKCQKEGVEVKIMIHIAGFIIFLLISNVSCIAESGSQKSKVRLSERDRIKCETNVGRHDVIFLEGNKLAYNDTVHDHHGKIVIWDYSKRQKVDEIVDEISFIHDYDISVDEKFMANGGGGDYYLKVWDLSKSEIVFSKKGPPKKIGELVSHVGTSDLAFTKDSRYLITGTDGSYSLSVLDYNHCFSAQFSLPL